ncbi:hypothetical protein D3C86_1748680 [compost metagenome]
MNSTASTLIVTSSALPARCATITAAANAGVTSKLFSCAAFARLPKPSSESRKSRGSWLSLNLNPPLILATPTHTYGRKIAIKMHHRATVIKQSLLQVSQQSEFHHQYADQHQPTG